MTARMSMVPLGDEAMLVRFADSLSAEANQRAVGFAARLAQSPPVDVLEIVPSLVSVQLRLRPGTDFRRLAGELSLMLREDAGPIVAQKHDIAITYDGDDIEEVAALCGLTRDGFVVVRPSGAAGTVWFAAGQTAIPSTPIRTGWHVIGHTTLRNFDASVDPPTVLRAGDVVRFRAS
jgi:inhibitor of KinA